MEYKKRYCIIQLCMAMFCITFPLFLVKGELIQLTKINQIFMVILYGIAGCGLYLIVGNRLKKDYEEVFN